MLSYIPAYLTKLAKWECTTDEQISNKERPKKYNLPTSIIFLRICLNRSVKASDFFFNRLRPVWAPFKRAFMMVWALLNRGRNKNVLHHPKGLGKKLHMIFWCGHDRKYEAMKKHQRGKIAETIQDRILFILLFISSSKLPGFWCRTGNSERIQTLLPSLLSHIFWRIFLTKISVAILQNPLC